MKYETYIFENIKIVLFNWQNSFALNINVKYKILDSTDRAGSVPPEFTSKLNGHNWIRKTCTILYDFSIPLSLKMPKIQCCIHWKYQLVILWQPLKWLYPPQYGKLNLLQLIIYIPWLGEFNQLPNTNSWR